MTGSTSFEVIDQRERMGDSLTRTGLYKVSDYYTMTVLPLTWRLAE